MAIGIGDWRITGSLRIATSSGLLSIRPAALKGRDFLRAWIAHLALCVAVPPGIEPCSFLIEDKGAFTYCKLTPAEATTALQDLLALYAALHAKPLPLFPESSMAFTEYSLNIGGRKTADPLDAAKGKWLGGQFSTGKPESRDPWNALIWRDAPEPLGEDFAKLALAVFTPLLNHRTPLK